MLPGLLLLAMQVGEFGGPLQAPLRPETASEVLRYVAEPEVVAAGRQAEVEVHLRVREGFHVNSHRPKSDLLIPTTAAVKAAEPGVTVGEVAYPAGESYRFAGDPGETLDVYTGTVTLRVPVVAAKGEHLLQGMVRYQACDARSCLPPRTLVIAVPFTAK